MSVAAKTRSAVRERPFLQAALRAGIVNHAAAARALDVSDDIDAVATALRRYREQLAEWKTADRAIRVSMRSGLEPEPSDEGLLVIGDQGFGPGDGDLTGIIAQGTVDAAALEHVLAVLRTNQVTVTAAGTSSTTLIVIVDRPNAADAVRHVEDALAGVPIPTD